jgi:hypothetical protein
MHRSQILYSAVIAMLMTFAMAVFVSTCALSIPTKPVKVDWYYDQILFEVAAVKNCAPSPEALNQFREQLHTTGICHRDKVTFRVNAVAFPPPPDLWDFEILEAFELVTREYRDLDPTDRDLSVFVAYADGFMTVGEQILMVGGLTYRPTSFVIFKDLVSEIEAEVLLHEFGHVMGMVPVTADNYDEKHPNHCLNKECVMYFSIPTGHEFDTACQGEIRRLARKRRRDK